MSSTIRNNPKNCIGAFDSTHIPAIVSLVDNGRFRNRKGFISQNVLAVVNFDLTFSYALTGWEGSAHDSKVYEYSKSAGFPNICGKYYLAEYLGIHFLLMY